LNGPSRAGPGHAGRYPPSSSAFRNRFFFELVRRKGYEGYGVPNAPIRLAAQSRFKDEAEGPALDGYDLRLLPFHPSDRCEDVRRIGRIAHYPRFALAGYRPAAIYASISATVRGMPVLSRSLPVAVIR
jgi:hypothetical protein